MKAQISLHIYKGSVQWCSHIKGMCFSQEENKIGGKEEFCTLGAQIKQRRENEEWKGNQK